MWDTIDVPSLVLGHDNQDSMAPLWIQSDYFQRFIAVPITTYYSDYQDRKLTGNRRQRRVGTPSARWSFGSLLVCEYKYLYDTYWNGSLDVLVTVRTENHVTRQWETFNATMEIPDRRDILESLRDFDIVFKEMTLV